MKEIKAVFRPFKLPDVLTELREIEGLPGVTVSEVRRFWKNSAKDRDSGLVDFVAKVKIEVVVPDEMVEKIVSVIQAAAHTGNTGDGKIFIIPVDDVVKIRTNERGAGAL